MSSWLLANCQAALLTLLFIPLLVAATSFSGLADSKKNLSSFTASRQQIELFQSPAPDSLVVVAKSGYGRFVKVEKADKYGLRDSFGFLATTVKYEEIEPLKNGYMKFTLHGLKGLLDADGDEIVESYGFQDIRQLQEYFVCTVGKKVLIADQDFKTIIPPSYSLIFPFSEGYFLVFKGNHRNALLDSSGNVLIGMGRGLILDWKKNQVIESRRRNKVAFYDYSVNQLIDYKYQAIKFHNDSQLLVKKRRKWVISNLQGEPINENWHRDIRYISGDKLQVWNGRKRALADLNANQITDYSFDYISAHRGHFIVKNKKKFGLIDARGGEVIPLEYGKLDWKSYGKYFYYQNGRWGLMDSLGKELTGAEFDRIYDHTRSDDFVHFMVTRDGLHGWLNEDGELFIPIKYELVSGFKGELASVGKKDDNGTTKWGAVNREGVEMVPLVYDRLVWNPDSLHAFIKDEKHVFDSHGNRLN